jgi:uncharacterized protein (DUF952 family)
LVVFQHPNGPLVLTKPGQAIPHIYGPLDPAAVTTVLPLCRNPEGTFS